MYKLPRLKFPEYKFRFRKNPENKTLIFDELRKKWMVLTPEEWVRQNTIRFLTGELKFPETVFKVETGLQINRRDKRSDILVYKNGQPILLVECKAPEVTIDASVLDQALVYNQEYKAPYLLLTNGLNHLLFHDKSGELLQLKTFINYQDL